MSLEKNTFFAFRRGRECDPALLRLTECPESAIFRYEEPASGGTLPTPKISFGSGTASAEACASVARQNRFKRKDVLFMKTIAVLACALVMISSSGAPSFSQVQSWPPGGTVVSPITSGMNLPANRYVPSSRDYNLVWADELTGQPAGKVRFIAQNYVASQKMAASQVADYRAYNPNFLCVIYHLSNGINPQNDNDCPLPHGTTPITSCTPKGWVSEWDSCFTPWLAASGITQGSSRFEQMFQHYTSVDPNNRVWHTDPQWTMCLENADWQKYVADETINWMTGEQNEGCFFDVCVETMVPGLYNPAAGDPAAAQLQLVPQPVRARGLHRRHTRRLFRLDERPVPWILAGYLQKIPCAVRRLSHYSQRRSDDHRLVRWMEGNVNGETIDGAMMESFGNATGSDMYLTLSRAVKHLTGRGKILIAQFYDSTQAERYRRTGMYMLVKNENSFINILPQGGPSWFPEYEITLGDQSPVPAVIDSLRVAGSGSASLFKRDYQNGMVLCNTSGTAMNYTPGGGT